MLLVREALRFQENSSLIDWTLLSTWLIQCQWWKKILHCDLWIGSSIVNILLNKLKHKNVLIKSVQNIHLEVCFYTTLKFIQVTFRQQIIYYISHKESLNYSPMNRKEHTLLLY